MSDSAAWISVSPSRRDRYGDEALALDAPLFQLPYWNEPLRAMGFRPRYRTLHDDARTLAYATVLQIGPPGARLGLVQRGPVVSPGGGLHTDIAARSLAAWSRRHGFMFLRFTHPAPMCSMPWPDCRVHSVPMRFRSTATRAKSWSCRRSGATTTCWHRSRPSHAGKSAARSRRHFASIAPAMRSRSSACGRCSSGSRRGRVPLSPAPQLSRVAARSPAARRRRRVRGVQERRPRRSDPDRSGPAHGILHRRRARR